MSQEQPRREEAEQEHEPVKQEKDVSNVQESSLARKKAVSESIGAQVLNYSTPCLLLYIFIKFLLCFIL